MFREDIKLIRELNETILLDGYVLREMSLDVLKWNNKAVKIIDYEGVKWRDSVAVFKLFRQ